MTRHEQMPRGRDRGDRLSVGRGPRKPIPKPKPRPKNPVPELTAGPALDARIAEALLAAVAATAQEETT